MWDDKLRHLAQEGFRRRPQSPLRGARTRPRREERIDEPGFERPPYEGVGTDLRTARLSQGRELAEVSEVLHIQPRYLQAIEEGRFDDLPGSTYAIGFMRAYSRYLGADAEEAVLRFRQESTLPHGPTKLVAPEAVAEPRRPRLTVVVLPLLAAALLYGGWVLLGGNGEAPDGTVEPAPERLSKLLEEETRPARVEPVPRRLLEAAAAVGGPSADGAAGVMAARAADNAAAREAERDASASMVASLPAEPPPPTPTAARPEPKPAAPSSAELEDTPPARPTLATVEVPQAAPPVPQPPPRAERRPAAAAELPPLPPSADGTDYVPQRFGSDDGESRVVLKARVDSWVQIQTGRKETLLTRILRAGDTFYAPNRADLLLTTGNVGGLEVIVDGEPLGPLGPLGAVRRNIPLDAERLLAEVEQR